MAASSGFKNLCSTPMHFPRNLPCTLSRSRTHLILTLLLTISVFFLLSASLPDISPAVAAASFASRIISASNYISSFSTITSLNTHVLSNSNDGSTISAVTTVERSHKNSRKSSDMMEEDLGSCDIFDGHWVVDDSTPLYKPGSCPYIDDAFNCFKNGRSDSDYLRLRWKPHGCQIPRFNGRRMLRMLRGKRLVFVGDSLNRNMWESLVCALRESLVDKSRVFEVSGRREFKTQGFYSFRFIDYRCSIDFVRSPFLVQEWKMTDMTKNRRETLRLDMIEDSSAKYQHADIIIFNTGHWWTHQKTYKGNNYFQEGDHIYKRLEVKEAYTKALRTWAQWVDANINTKRTRVFFRGYSASHFKGGQWNSGGNCDGETQPITNDTYLGRYPWMMNVLESVISEMKTPVMYMNITKMSDYRKDGHPSVYRQAENQRSSGMLQDCSHWCLPGVPDLWNELLYTTLLISHHDLGSTKSVEFL